MLIKVLPRPILQAIGAGMGRLFFRIDRRHRELTKKNLRETLGSDLIAVHVFEHFGRMVLDSIKLWSLHPDRLKQLFDVEGVEHMQAALSRGRGAVLFTAHYGNWEMGAVNAALLFGPMLIIARALDNRLLEKHLQAKREKIGNHVIEKRESARPALRTLKSGHIVAILIDQRVPANEGFAGTFLGRPAFTTPAAARLAQQTGAGLVPGFCEPIHGSSRLRTVYLQEIPTTINGIQRPIADIVQECNDVISGFIRKRPELWLWMHDRWKIPENES